MRQQVLTGLRKRPELRKASCWIVTVSPGDPRASELARRHNCLVQSSTYYSDYTLMLLAPRSEVGRAECASLVVLRLSFSPTRRVL